MDGAKPPDNGSYSKKHCATRPKRTSHVIERNALVQGDCIQEMARLEPGSVDLVFADPPFNIGYKYDVYEDRKEADDYLAWTRQWTEQVQRILKPNGTFWLAIGDDFAAELK